MKKSLLIAFVVAGTLMAGGDPCKNVVAHSIKMLRFAQWMSRYPVCSYGVQVIAGIADKPVSPKDDPVRAEIARKAKTLLERAKAGDTKAIGELRAQIAYCEKVSIPVPNSFIRIAYSSKELFGVIDPETGVYKPFGR